MRRAHQSKEIPWGIIKIWARKTPMKFFFLSSSSLGRNDISFLQFYSTSKDHPHFQQNHYICIFPRSLYFLKKSFLPQLKESGRWIMFKDRCTFLIKEERNMIKMIKYIFKRCYKTVGLPTLTLQVIVLSTNLKSRSAYWDFGVKRPIGVGFN